MLENKNERKTIYYSKKNDLEIIKKYQDLILYVYKILEKYPEKEQFNLAKDTKEILLLGLKYLVFVKNSYNKAEKLHYLLEAQTNISLSLLFVRIAVKSKYITKKNYTAWSYKISEINTMLQKWIRSCQRQ